MYFISCDGIVVTYPREITKAKTRITKSLETARKGGGSTYRPFPSLPRFVSRKAGVGYKRTSIPSPKYIYTRIHLPVFTKCGIVPILDNYYYYVIPHPYPLFIHDYINTYVISSVKPYLCLRNSKKKKESHF